MLLTKKFIFKTNRTEAIILGHLTYSASKLFNEANYQRYEFKKLKLEKRPNWYDQKKNMKNNMWYKNLPSQTAQDVLKTLDESWKSYDVLKYKFDHGKKLSGEPRAPYYKKDGSHTNITYLTNGFKLIENKIRFAIPKAMKEHLLKKFNIDSEFFYIPIKESIDGEIKEISFSFIRKFEYEVFISYETFVKPIKPDNGRHISIDLGINNLMTVYDNVGRSFIISGNSYLQTLHYYNKQIAHYQSINDEAHKKDIKLKKHLYQTRRINELFEKKERKISYILHSSTKTILDYCLANNITKVVIGDIKGIDNHKTNQKGKKEKEFNQKLHSLPFDKIYHMLDYKLRKRGITLIKQNEAFTSQCSPATKEVSSEFADKNNRIYRGLYQEGNAIYNADSVGAFNILRKYYQENNIETKLTCECLSNPKKISIPVTSNSAKKEVGIMGRNCPDFNMLQSMLESMLGNSIAE